MYHPQCINPNDFNHLAIKEQQAVIFHQAQHLCNYIFKDVQIAVFHLNNYFIEVAYEFGALETLYIYAGKLPSEELTERIPIPS